MGNHPVLRAAQPVTLLFLNFGALLSVSVIPLTSFDENSGISVMTLDRMCQTVPWFYMLGLIVIYGAIFIKLARVNKVLQSVARQRVTFKQVAYPAMVLFVVQVILLISW